MISILSKCENIEMSKSLFGDVQNMKGIEVSSDKDERMMRDDVWVEGLNQGDTHAFEAIYKCFYPQLFNYLLHYLKSESAIEDIIQGVFYRIWRNRESIEPRGTLRGYLFTSVRNQALKHIKSNKRVEGQRTEATDENLIVYQNPESTYELHELEEAYQKTVQNLPEKRREIYIMHRQHQLTYREIAAILNISEKTVETQMRRALKFLSIHLLRFK